VILVAEVLAFHLILLHGPNGQEIAINPQEITSLREPTEASGDHVAKGVKCLVTMTNGKVNGVVEDCGMVKVMTEEAQ